MQRSAIPIGVPVTLFGLRIVYPARILERTEYTEMPTRCTYHIHRTITSQECRAAMQHSGPDCSCVLRVAGPAMLVCCRVSVLRLRESVGVSVFLCFCIATAKRVLRT